MSDVVIVDCGLSNIGSLRRALQACGARVSVAREPSEAERSARIVLPGVGAFGDAARILRQRGWDRYIADRVGGDGVRLLGICLGMQLLVEESEEGDGRERGLGLLPGVVRRLVPVTAQERIPHVGWNAVHWQAGNPLFQEIRQGDDFYFVHSYHVTGVQPDHVAATTPYCGGFCSAVQGGNVFGVQFHPEKSSIPGQMVLRNFLAL